MNQENLLQEIRSLQETALPPEFIVENLQGMFATNPTIKAGLAGSSREVAKLFYPLLHSVTELEEVEGLVNLPVDLPLVQAIRICMEVLPVERLLAGIESAFTAVCVDRLRSEYTIAKSLGLQLCETEVRGLRCDDIHLPYPSVFIDIPPGLPLAIIIQNEVVQLCGLLLKEDRKRNLFVSCDLNNGRKQTLLHGRFFLEDGAVLLADALTREHATVKMTPEVAIARAQIMRFAVNTILYMTWPDAEVDHVLLNPHARALWDKIENTQPSKRRDRLQAMFAGMDSSRHYLLGRSVIYVSRQQQMEKDQTAGRHTGAKLLAYQRIPGFWRNQPYGPHNSLRRRQWIQPYCRGPEYGVLSQPVHNLLLRTP